MRRSSFMFSMFKPTSIMLNTNSLFSVVGSITENNSTDQKIDNSALRQKRIEEEKIRQYRKTLLAAIEARNEKEQERLLKLPAVPGSPGFGNCFGP